MGRKKHAIGPIMFGLMIMVALTFDVISCVPFLNIAIIVVSDIVFIIWFKMCGVSFTKFKHMIPLMAGGTIVGLIPFVSILPEITAVLVTNVILMRAQEKLDQMNGTDQNEEEESGEGEAVPA